MTLGRQSVRRLTFSGAVVITFFLSVLYPCAATAATYYVATSGNDANSGSQTLPFRTINKGLRALAAGDTLFIRAGTYTESINSNSQPIPTGTSWADAPQIRAYPGETVVVTGGLNLADSYVQYVIFDGITWDAQHTYKGLSFQNGAHHIRVMNGEVRNIYGQAIQGGFNASVATHHIELVNLAIHNNGFPTVVSEPPAGGSGGRYDHGIYMTVQNLLIEGCDIYANTGNGIQIYWEGGANANNTVIRNNRIHGNLGDVNVTLNYNDNLQFYNNLVYGATSGVHVRYSVTNAKIYNNTIYNHTNGYGIYVGSGSTSAVVKNNIVYSNASPIVNDGVSTTVSSNLSTNPSYVNAAGGDFHLLAGSAAIGKGETISLVTTDFDGMPRAQGAYDIGAYQYASQSPPAAPTNVRIVR